MALARSIRLPFERICGSIFRCDQLEKPIFNLPAFPVFRFKAFSSEYGRRCIFSSCRFVGGANLTNLCRFVIRTVILFFFQIPMLHYIFCSSGSSYYQAFAANCIRETPFISTSHY